MGDTDLNKSKIININDFIFHQNLEFYPNLTGLTCEDNTLIYRMSGNIISSEVLTFDLRTLPGEAWNVSPGEFMRTVRLNKDCKGLTSFRELIKNVVKGENTNIEQLKSIVDGHMSRYFNAKDNSHLLMEENKILLGQIEYDITTIPQDNPLKKLIDNKLDEYANKNKQLGNTGNVLFADDLKQQANPLVLSRVKKDNSMSSRAAFVNVAILLYGILNIGFILALALIRK